MDDPQVTHRRCRIEWPTEDATLELLDTLKDNQSPTVPSQVTAESKCILEEELAKVATATSMAEDDAAVMIVYMPEHLRNWLAVLNNLYWRVRRQSAVWDCFCQLLAVGLIDASALEAPLTVHRTTTEAAEHVVDLLICFKYSRDDSDRSYDGKLGLQNVDWHLDLKWLAIMIVRGGRNLHDIYDKIDQMGYLGPTVESLLKRTLAKHDGMFWKLQNDKEDSIATLVNGSYPKEDHTFGFIFAHGLGPLAGSDWKTKVADAGRSFLERFNEIEEAYRCEHKLERHQLCLEREQAQYFEDLPDRLPGWGSDRADYIDVRDQDQPETPLVTSSETASPVTPLPYVDPDWNPYGFTGPPK